MNMNRIGNVIKEFRCKFDMSRKELSANICSEKYVYLIEKGERSPSTDITVAFSDKRRPLHGIDYYLS
jgi:DNA-binding XRE family transcriptional regulator